VFLMCVLQKEKKKKLQGEKWEAVIEKKTGRSRSFACLYNRFN
jgi:hypothetical protein